MSTEAPATFAPEAERVASVLRDQIVDGARAPGSKLVERELAAEMAVSRIPVRDALRVLVAEGLVTPRPRTWAVVRTFTTSDIDELIEVRSALETLAFRLAAERGSADQLAELGGHLADERRAVKAGDAQRARRAAADFHETVIAMAANRLLSELFASTGSRIRWLLGQHTQHAAMAAEHAALYHALVERDAERAATLAESHLVTSRRAVFEHRAGHPPATAE
jgi:DNA-binding GntR family transcriptional regulator